MDDQLKTLQSWINESSYTVAVTGAGVSVTAGIPDSLSEDIQTFKRTHEVLRVPTQEED